MRLLELTLNAACDGMNVPVAPAAHQHDKFGVIDLAADIDDLDARGLLVEPRTCDGQGQLLRFVRRAHLVKFG